MSHQPYRESGRSSGYMQGKSGEGRPVLPMALAAGIFTLGAIAVWHSRQRATENRGSPDSAPGWTSRHARFGNMAVVGRSVTINRPRAELYAFWRDFKNLPQFMENIVEVDVAGDLTTWTIRAPAHRTVEVKSRVVADKLDEQIAWRSVEGSQIESEGKVMFRDAPGGRGTIVEAIIAYHPPAGELGRMIAKLFQAEPGIQGRRDLKRFKMLMETGEVTTSHNRKSDGTSQNGGTDARIDVSRNP